MPRASALRLLVTLEEHGFVRRIGQNYSIGHRVLVLASRYDLETALDKMAVPILERLRDITGETTQLAVLSDWQVVYIARVLSHQPIAYMRSHTGTVLPAYCTGLGKALLAAKPTAEVEAWARTQSFPRLTPTSITSAKALLAELKKIRTRGYSIDDEERELGVRCVAAVVRDRTGNAVAALSIAGPPERLPSELEGSDVAKAVVDCAARLSERLGWVEPSQGGV